MLQKPKMWRAPRAPSKKKSERHGGRERYFWVFKHPLGENSNKAEKLAFAKEIIWQNCMISRSWIEKCRRAWVRAWSICIFPIVSKSSVSHERGWKSWNNERHARWERDFILRISSMGMRFSCLWTPSMKYSNFWLLKGRLIPSGAFLSIKRLERTEVSKGSSGSSPSYYSTSWSFWKEAVGALRVTSWKSPGWFYMLQ